MGFTDAEMGYALSDVDSRLKKSLPYVADVTRRLVLAGIGVICPPTKIRNPDEDPVGYAASKDLIVFLDTDFKLALEVKSKDIPFDATPLSWPSNLDPVYLYSSRKVAHGKPPFAVLLCSMQYVFEIPVLALIVPGVTGEAETLDGRRQGSHAYAVATAPASLLLSWDQFVPKLKDALRAKGR